MNGEDENSMSPPANLAKRRHKHKLHYAYNANNTASNLAHVALSSRAGFTFGDEKKDLNADNTTSTKSIYQTTEVMSYIQAQMSR